MPNDPGALVAAAREARNCGRLAEAAAFAQQAVDVCRSNGAAGDLARALAMAGQIERDSGQHAAAIELYVEAAAIARSAGDTLYVAHCFRHIADIYCDSHEHARAEPHYLEALALYRSSGNAHLGDIANALRGYAVLKQDIGDAAAAAALWCQAGELYQRSGIAAGAAESARRVALLRQTG